MAGFSRFIGRTFFKMIGWKIVGEVPKPKKYVICLAPHTSIWDMIWGKMYNWALDMRPKIMVKKEFFFFPVGPIIKFWGAIPVDRNYPGGVVKQLADRYDKSDNLIVCITPEGTRKANPNWKTGFYRIAKEAGVPIFLALIDFNKKEVGFMGEFKISDNMESDLEEIKQRYKGMRGIYKEKFAI